eukprot:5494982-Alexandrium_andersonii.AAC.1
MSASLVGSEMCIRDSPRRFREVRSASVFALIRSQTTFVSGYFEGGPRAVSYTHLTLPTICSV